jgi:putative hydrolase of the HAD superfamily
MEMSKVKVLFLDIGGLLLSNGWGHESTQKAGQTFGFDYAEMETLHHFIFNYCCKHG